MRFVCCGAEAGRDIALDDSARKSLGEVDFGEDRDLCTLLYRCDPPSGHRRPGLVELRSPSSSIGAAGSECRLVFHIHCCATTTIATHGRAEQGALQF